MHSIPFNKEKNNKSRYNYTSSIPTEVLIGWGAELLCPFLHFQCKCRVYNLIIAALSVLYIYKYLYPVSWFDGRAGVGSVGYWCVILELRSVGTGRYMGMIGTIDGNEGDVLLGMMGT